MGEGKQNPTKIGIPSHKFSYPKALLATAYPDTFLAPTSADFYSIAVA